MTQIRYLAGYLVVAATLPYLTLKLLWLTGHPVGLADPSLLDDGGLQVVNAITFGLDAAAVVLAMTLTHGWGLRAPVALVTAPIWVGTGLLAPVVVIAPAAAALASGGADVLGSGSPVHPWVYVMVYGGFFGQALGLAVAFVGYVGRRWTGLSGARLGGWPRGATHRLQGTLGAAAAALATVAGVARLAWAAGVRSGLPERVVTARTAASGVVEGTHGLVALVGAAGLLMLLRRRPVRCPLWIPLAMAWAGCGSMFAWGTWNVTNVLGASRLEGGGPGAAANLVSLALMLAGLLGGTVGAVALSERSTMDRPRAGHGYPPGQYPPGQYPPGQYPPGQPAAAGSATMSS